MDPIWTPFRKGWVSCRPPVIPCILGHTDQGVLRGVQMDPPDWGPNGPSLKGYNEAINGTNTSRRKRDFVSQNYYLERAVSGPFWTL